MENITVSLKPEALAIAKLAVDDLDISLAEFLSEELNKMLEQKEKQYARQRLNIHKRSVVDMINKQIKGFESLEQSYISLGLSESVRVFGGIRKVYDEIYVKTGNPLPQSKIRLNGLVVVNAE